MKFFFKKLKIVNNINLNNNTRFVEHKKNLEKKKALKSRFFFFYKEI